MCCDDPEQGLASRMLGAGSDWPMIDSPPMSVETEELLLKVATEFGKNAARTRENLMARAFQKGGL